MQHALAVPEGAAAGAAPGGGRFSAGIVELTIEPSTLRVLSPMQQVTSKEPPRELAAEEADAI